MHDPNTVAFEIRSPIVKKSKWWPEGYRESLVTIWHVDPEIDGDDDSCGWFAPRLSDADLKAMAEFARKEWDFWLSPKYQAISHAHNGNFEILAGVWAIVRQQATGKSWHESLTAWEIGQVLRLLCNPNDNFGHLIRDAKERQEGFERLLVQTLRHYRRLRRPWWQHPKFHLHHWRFQIHPVQAFKRFTFSRCAGCGKRFPWGYSPVSTGWSHGGPKWFRGEQGVYHHECRQLVTIPEDDA